MVSFSTTLGLQTSVLFLARGFSGHIFNALHSPTHPPTPCLVHPIPDDEHGHSMLSPFLSAMSSLTPFLMARHCFSCRKDRRSHNDCLDMLHLGGHASPSPCLRLHFPLCSRPFSMLYGSLWLLFGTGHKHANRCCYFLDKRGVSRLLQKTHSQGWQYPFVFN